MSPSKTKKVGRPSIGSNLSIAKTQLPETERADLEVLKTSSGCATDAEVLRVLIFYCRRQNSGTLSGARKQYLEQTKKRPNPGSN